MRKNRILASVLAAMVLLFSVFSDMYTIPVLAEGEEDAAFESAGLYVSFVNVKENGSISLYDWDDFSGNYCQTADPNGNIAFRFADGEGNISAVSADELSVRYFIDGNPVYYTLEKDGITTKECGTFSFSDTDILVYSVHFSRRGYYEITYMNNGMEYYAYINALLPEVGFYTSEWADYENLYDNWGGRIDSIKTDTVYAMLGSDDDWREYRFANTPLEYIDLYDVESANGQEEEVTEVKSISESDFFIVEPVVNDADKVIGYKITFNNSKKCPANKWGEIWLQVNGYCVDKNPEQPDFEQINDVESRVLIVKPGEPEEQGLYVTGNIGFSEYNVPYWSDEYDDFRGDYFEFDSTDEVCAAFRYVDENGTTISINPNDLFVRDGDKVMTLAEANIKAVQRGYVGVEFGNQRIPVYSITFPYENYWELLYRDNGEEYTIHLSILYPQLGFFANEDKTSVLKDGYEYSYAGPDTIYALLGWDNDWRTYYMGDYPLVYNYINTEGKRVSGDVSDLNFCTCKEITVDGKVVGFAIDIDTTGKDIDVVGNVQITARAYKQGMNADEGIPDGEPVYGERHLVIKNLAFEFSEDAEFVFDNGITVKYSKGVLTFSGEGAIPDFSDGGDAAEAAFWDQYKKEIRSIVFEEGITQIGAYTFEWCESLTSVSFPSTLKQINACAFMYSSALKNISLPEGLEVLEDAVFSVSGLSGVINLPASLKKVSASVFDNSKVTGFNVAEENDTYVSFDGVLYEKLASGVYSLIAFPAGRTVSEYSVAEGTAIIGKDSFSLAKVSKVILPDTVKRIEESAFRYSSITEMNLPNSITYIGGGAFYSCVELTSITVPGGIEAINDWLFYNCISLESVVLGDGITSIGGSAFGACGSLKTVQIPASVANFADNVFEGASSSLLIRGYSGSAAEVYATVNGYQFESIGSAVVTVVAEGTLGENNEITWQVMSNSQLNITGSGAIPDFAGSWTLPWYNYDVIHVEIGEGITRIGNYAFINMPIVSISLPDSLEAIGSRVFELTMINSLHISKNVKSIEPDALRIQPSSLKEITVDPENKYFSCDGTALFNYERTKLIKFIQKTSPINFEPVKYNVPDTVKTIGEYAFAGCGFDITLPESVERLEAFSFFNSAAERIVIPKSVTYIDEEAFNAASYNAFYVDTENIKYTSKDGVLFTKDMTVLIKYPNSKLATFYSVPESVIGISGNAFDMCYFLRGILFTQNTQMIPNGSIIPVAAHTGMDDIVMLLYGYADTAVARYPENNAQSGSFVFLEIPTKEYKKLTIACPVDVYVYDEEHKLVASVVDELVVTYDETIYADNMEKVVYLPNSSKYSIEIIATGEGKVSYTMEEVTKGKEKEEVTNKVEFKDIPIQDGDKLAAGVSMMVSSNKEDYAIEKNDSTGITADTVILEEEESAGQFVKVLGHNLALNEDVSVNFYVDLSEEVLKDGEAYIIAEGGQRGTKKVYIKDCVDLTEVTSPMHIDDSVALCKVNNSGTVCYKISVKIAAAEMTNNIRVQVYANNTSSDVFSYSVKEYVNDIITDSKYSQADINSSDAQIRINAQTYRLVKALATYGVYAQEYFENCSETVISDSEMLDISNANTGYARDEYSYSWSRDISELGVYELGISLVMLSKPVTRFYFSINKNMISDISEVSVVDSAGNEYVINKKGAYYYFDIPSVSISRAYEAKSLTMTINGREHVDFAIGTFEYCDRALKVGTSSDKLTKLIKAYLLYSETAYDYVNMSN